MILMIRDKQKMIYKVGIIIILVIIIGCIYKFKNSNASRFTNTSLPTDNKSVLRLVDYGSKPCKCQPKPKLFEELEKKYQGKIFFEYVDTFTAIKDGIKEIPAQVIYDANNKELARHEGSTKEEDIIKLVESVIEK
jgi:hypothetical protein